MCTSVLELPALPRGPQDPVRVRARTNFAMRSFMHFISEGNSGLTDGGLASVLSVLHNFRRALEEAAKGGFLELLALSLENRPAGADDGTLVLRLTFAGGASLRLTLSALSCGLEDLADPWPTRWRPRHG